MYKNVRKSERIGRNITENAPDKHYIYKQEEHCWNLAYTKVGAIVCTYRFPSLSSSCSVRAGKLELRVSKNGNSIPISILLRR